MATDKEAPAVLGKLIDLAQAAVAAQLQSASDDANKALATLTLDAALAGGLTAARLADPSITSWWWLPLIGFALAFAFLLAALRPLPLVVGPEPEAMYRITYGMAEGDAYRQILGGLIESFNSNEPMVHWAPLALEDARGEELRRIRLPRWFRVSRSRWYFRGLFTVSGTVIVGAILLPALTLWMPSG
jgi:hypothetical protein